MKNLHWELLGCSFVFFITSFLIYDFQTLFCLLSILTGGVLFYDYWQELKDYNILIYGLFLFRIVLTGKMVECSLLLLTAGLFYSFYLSLYQRFYDKESSLSKIGISEISCLIVLAIGTIISLDRYWYGLVFMTIFTGFTSIYRLYSIICVSLLKKKRIIIQNEEIFQQLFSFRSIVFNKTGVLTLGDFEVTKVVSNKESLLWKYLIYAETGLDTPISCAVLNFKQIKVDLKKRIDYQVFPNGIYYRYGKHDILVGSDNFLKENGIQFEKAIVLGTILYVVQNDQVIGYVALSDKIHATVKDSIQELKNMGIINMTVFSKDQEYLTTAIARMLDIKSSYGELTSNKRDFWLYYLKKIYGEDIIYIGDETNSINVKAKIKFNALSSSIDKEDDIIILEQNFKSCVDLFKMSHHLKRLKKNLIKWNILGKIIMLIVSLLWISDLWVVHSIMFLWMTLELALGVRSLLKIK